MTYACDRRSAVGFLIERYRLGACHRLYETGNYPSVYATSLENLEAAWRVRLQEPEPQDDP